MLYKPLYILYRHFEGCQLLFVNNYVILCTKYRLFWAAFGGDFGFGLHIDQDDKGGLSEKEATFSGSDTL